MWRDDVKTTGNPGGLWERVREAWRGAREGWVGGGERRDVASDSPWPHPIPQSRPQPPSRRSDGVGALSRHDLVEALASGLDGCYTLAPDPHGEHLRVPLADTDIPEELADAIIALAGRSAP